MKAAFLTIHEPSDVSAFSGSAVQMRQALQNAGIQTECVGGLAGKHVRWSKIKKACYAVSRSGKFLRNRELSTVHAYARQAQHRLASISCDCVVSPGTIPLAFLETRKPIIFWTDATFAGLLDFYPTYSRLCRETVRNGHRIEQAALSRCALAIYSSQWAANTAVGHYDVDPRKVRVVPFGANITCERDMEDIVRLVDHKPLDVCKLLFMGVDWHRKGGETVLAAAELLHQRGIPVELHLVGCRPPGRTPAFVRHHGFVSKNTDEGRRYLDRLFSEVHFLILPSIADCVPMVFAEANSFGIPCLSTNVGGIRTAIRDGRNGRTFPLGERPAAYCDYIQQLIASPAAYRRLALSSFGEYQTRLNWSSAATRVRQLIEALLIQRAGGHATATVSTATTA